MKPIPFFQNASTHGSLPGGTPATLSTPSTALLDTRAPTQTAASLPQSKARCSRRIAQTLLALIERDSREHTRGMQWIASMGLTGLIHQRIAEQLVNGHDRPRLSELSCVVDAVCGRLDARLAA
jgi:hypothetical protein